MAKFPFKRPRIISKKFPELDSSIDGVTKSLNDLVFSYHEQVQNALMKKHWMMAFSSIVLLLVLGSFISMKGKADSSIFYPETCLGGWLNPQNAQGEPETTSNGDESQFTKDNSAILPKNTNAEMYCGNFKGKFDTATKPTKIIVSLALTKGTEIQERLVQDTNLLVATATESIPDVIHLETASSSSIASSTEVALEATTTESLLQASSSIPDTAVATPGAPKEEGPSILDGIVKSLQDTVNDLFLSTEEKTTQTDTVVIPPPIEQQAEQQPTPAPAPAADPQAEPVPQSEAPQATEPTSYAPTKHNWLSHFVESVFAEEATLVSSTSQTQDVTEVVAGPTSTEPSVLFVENITAEQSIDISTTSSNQEVSGDMIKKIQPVTEEVLGVATTTLSATSTDNGTSSVDILVAGTSTATSTELYSSTSTLLENATTTDENQTQNNFLELFYTFDGKTWQSLGLLNEISMKYRTFEIPVTASTSWLEMSQLQIKIESKKQEQDTPKVYLDGVRVEVLYEAMAGYAHPDFKKDTILKDEIYDGMRVVTIINNETNREEVWYMYLEEERATSTDSGVATSTTATSTATDILSNSSSTEITPETGDTLKLGSTTVGIASSSTTQVIDVLASSSLATTTPYIKPVVPKNTWLKFDGVAKGYTLQSLVIHIKKVDEITLEHKEQEERIPDFTRDTIKKIKGMFASAMVVQVEKDTFDELWMYDVDNKTQEKISTGSSTSVSSSFPIGMKGDTVFWLSKDEGTVFAYSIEKKQIQSKVVPPYDMQSGEQASIIFDGIPWVVILKADGFYFFSEATGEVFSDDNFLAVEEFRKVMDLDKTLSNEAIDTLNLIRYNEGEEQ